MGVTSINTCWKRIGIWGDRSCQELPKVSHCRNCAVFCDAAVAQLDREVAPGDQAARSAHVAQPMARFRASRKEERVQNPSVLVFRIGKEWLAMPARCFAEVIERRTIHTLPHRTGEIVEGVVSIRGELVVCISLESLFGIETAGATASRRMLVVRHPTGRFVFGADEVYAGVRYLPEEVKSIPATLSLAAISCSIGIFEWVGRNVGIIDAEVLIQSVNHRLA